MRGRICIMSSTVCSSRKEKGFSRAILLGTYSIVPSLRIMLCRDEFLHSPWLRVLGIHNVQSKTEHSTIILPLPKTLGDIKEFSCEDSIWDVWCVFWRRRCLPFSSGLAQHVSHFFDMRGFNAFFSVGLCLK